jgi:tetratricopeptide (TPR) repeat protein
MTELSGEGRDNQTKNWELVLNSDGFMVGAASSLRNRWNCMINYVWTAKDPSGKKVVKEIPAATVEDAKFFLERQGYTDLVLKEDDVSSAVRAGFAKRKNLYGQEIKLSAEQRLKTLEDPPKTYWDALRKGVLRFHPLFLAVVFFVFYSWFRQEWGFVLFYVFGLLGLLGYVIYLHLPSVYFHKLVKADEWNRWNEVLSLVENLKWIKRFRKIALPEAALARHRAKALAGLGRLEEALAEYKQFKGQPDNPAWLYLLFVEGFYGIAKQYDKAIEYNLASIAEKPTSTGYLDLAERYARRKRDAAKARAALAEAEKSPLSDNSGPFLHRGRGVTACLEGDFAAAKSELTTAIELVEKDKHRHYRDGFLAIARGYLCCVLAKQGDLSGARKCLEQARAYLTATNEAELLAECRALCGEK